MKHTHVVLCALIAMGMALGSTSVYAADSSSENTNTNTVLSEWSEDEAEDTADAGSDAQISSTEDSADTAENPDDTSADADERSEESTGTADTSSESSDPSGTSSESADSSSEASEDTDTTDTETDADAEQDTGSSDENAAQTTDDQVALETSTQIAMVLGQTCTVNWSYSYTFTPDKTGYYEFKSTSSYDPYIYLRDHNGNKLAYYDNMTSSNKQFDLIIHLEKGKTYIVDMGMNDKTGAALKCTVTRQNTSAYNGIFQGSDGNQYYSTYHQINYSYTGLVKTNSGTLYVKEGQAASDYTGLITYDSTTTAGDCKPVVSQSSVSWAYISSGKEVSYTGLAQYGNNWYYVVNSQPDEDYTGLVKYESVFYYVENGLRDLTYTGLVKYNSNYWYVTKGVLDRSYTGVAVIGNKTYKVVRGKATGIDLETQIANTYAGALAIYVADHPDRAASFDGYCGPYCVDQMLYLGIETNSSAGFNGCDAYDYYCNNKKSTGGYDITAYSGSSYSLLSALKAVTANATKDVFNILVGLQTGSNGNKYGHSFFIHAIVQGVVYFTESYGSYYGSTYYDEGECIKCTIEELATKYSSNSYSSSIFDGLIYFAE